MVRKGGIPHLAMARYRTLSVCYLAVSCGRRMSASGCRFNRSTQQFADIVR
jgi:hypothetical protein